MNNKPWQESWWDGVTSDTIHLSSTVLIGSLEYTIPNFWDIVFWNSNGLEKSRPFLALVFVPEVREALLLQIDDPESLENLFMDWLSHIYNSYVSIALLAPCKAKYWQ